MNAALCEAHTGAAEGGIPIGAALVEGNRLVATGRNRRPQDSAAIMHAEINCELVSNVVENASRSFSTSSGDGLLGAHRQLG